MGRKKFDRLRTAIKISILWSTIFCVIVGLLFQSVFYNYCFTVYNRKHRNDSHWASSLRINGITFMLFGYYTVYSSLFPCSWKRKKKGLFLGLADKVSASFPLS